MKKYTVRYMAVTPWLIEIDAENENEAIRKAEFHAASGKELPTASEFDYFEAELKGE